MQTYHVTFHAERGCATEMIKANTAHAALAKALKMANDDTVDLDYGHYDSVGDLETIAVTNNDEKGDTAAWESTEVALQLAAPQLLEACQAPALDDAHDKLSDVLEDPQAAHDDICKAAVDLCLALNAHREKRKAAIAAATPACTAQQGG
jgi:hypothetical protein